MFHLFVSCGGAKLDSTTEENVPFSTVHVTLFGGGRSDLLVIRANFFIPRWMHILTAQSSCSLFEKSKSFISYRTVSFGCFLWRLKALSTLWDVWGLILVMLVTCSYAQVTIYVIGLRDIWRVTHEHQQFWWSCDSNYSKHGVSNQWCTSFWPGVSYIKLTRNTWSKWLCTLLGCSIVALMI